MSKPKIGNKNYHQGYYQIINKDKYIGNINNAVYRSLWEYKFMVFLDHNPKIKKWSSESITIPWKDLRGKIHRYYPDFYYEMETPDPNQNDKVVVELKPLKETKEPQKPVNETLKALKNYEYDIKTYLKNKLKWSSAIEYCEKRSMKFIVITEEHLKKANIL